MSALGMHLLLSSLAAVPKTQLPADTDATLRLGLDQLQQGNYVAALAGCLRALWAAGHTASADRQPESTPDWFAAFEAVIQQRLGGSSGSLTESAALPLLAAVSALYLFLQANLTGPAVSLPECPFDLLDESATQQAVDAQTQQAAGDAASGFGRDSISQGDRWAVSQLEEDGEEVIGRISSPQYLLLAKTILLAPAALAPSHEPPDHHDHHPHHQQQQQQQQEEEEEQPDAVHGAAVAAAGQSTEESDHKVDVRGELVPAGWAWWAHRAALLQQRVLAGRSATLRRALEGLTEQVGEREGLGDVMKGARVCRVQVSGGVLSICGARYKGVLQSQLHRVAAALRAGCGGALKQGGSCRGPEGSGEVEVLAHPASPGRAADGSQGGFVAAQQRLLRSAALLEAALAETAYGYVEAAGRYLRASCEAAGVRVQLTGALGVRTQHQHEAKAQLVVAVERTAGSPAGAAQAPAGPADEALEAGLLDAELAASHSVGREVSQELQGLQAATDVLPHPRLDPGGEGSGGGGLPTDLDSLEQALLLALASHVEKGSSSDALKPWEGAAYAEAVEQQQRSQFLLRCAAKLVLVRFEKERVRTRERALLALEQVVAAIQAEGSVQPAQRLRLAFSVWFPLGVSLKKELGELLVAAGVLGAALPLFEGLELWANLAVCYQLLGKKVQAEELVRRRLEATPDQPRLWCTLGDLTLEDKHYQEAWERSGHRSARAQRSLARNAMRRGDWPGTSRHWELALALNPLNPEGWFALGFAYIKQKDYPKALQACSRCVQLDPDNGEAWNNLAAIHMGAARWAEAFAALGEATRHKRDSWQTWENYADVAVKVGQWQVAVRALRQVLALSQSSRIQLGILKEIISEVERGRGVTHSSHSSQSSPPGQQDGRAGGDSASTATVEPDSLAVAGTAAAAAEGAGPPAPAAVPAAAEEDALGAEEGGEGLGALAQALASMGDAHGTQDMHSGPGGSKAGGAGAAAAAAPAREAQQAAAAAAAEAVSARERDALERAVGMLMKEVAGSAAGDSPFWERYARYYAATGQPEAARECLLKRVRALQGRGWQQDEQAFQAFAGASLQLCSSYLEVRAAEDRGVGGRELSSARLHLRGVLKQAAERFGEHPLYSDMQQLLARVEQAGQTQRQ
ncbi:hypothetical protein N2152v2_010999 [Parachlorella kessleri]